MCTSKSEKLGPILVEMYIYSKVVFDDPDVECVSTVHLLDHCSPLFFLLNNLLEKSTFLTYEITVIFFMLFIFIFEQQYAHY